MNGAAANGVGFLTETFKCGVLAFSVTAAAATMVYRQSCKWTALWLYPNKLCCGLSRLHIQIDMRRHLG